MPECTATRTVVCRLDELANPGSKGLSVACQDQVMEIFLVRQDARIYAYLNSCPHTGSPLDWLPDQFLSLDKRHILCANHAALFRLQDGVCISGPCAGESLTAVSAVVESGNVVLLLPAAAATD